MTSNLNLNSFLKFGYFMDYSNPAINFDLTRINKKKYADLEEEELKSIGIELWKNAIQKLYQPNKINIVPLSGGIDSRTILATLLEFVPAKDIYTYTFGSPGSYDFEIGNKIAKYLGTKHSKLSLASYKFSLNEEIEASKQIDHQTFLFHHPSFEYLNKFDKNCIFWSGYIIDWIAGSHLPKSNSNTIEEAMGKIYQYDSFVKSINLTNVPVNNLVELFRTPFIDNKLLSFEEQIELKHHLVKYTAPHILYKNINFHTPVLDTDLFSFYLSLEKKYRTGRYLFKKMVISAYPKLFSFPEKSNLGLSLNASKLNLLLRRSISKAKRMSNKVIPIFDNPGLNYINFEEGIRNRADLKKLIYENIMDLKNRKIIDWIDFDEIWERHINKKANHADALIVLASLEIHLKAGKKL